MTAKASLLLVALSPIAFAQTPLEDREPVIDRLAQGEWHYYSISPQNWHAQAGVAIKRLGDGNPDLYVRKGTLPTLSEWDFRPYRNSKYEIVRINEGSEPQLETAVYYVGVHGRSAGRYGVAADRFLLPSRHEGMGAIPFESGTSFRVWAPNATSVNVAGQFNNWSSTNAPMQSEGNGNWSLAFRNANAGQEYKYVIKNGASTLWKMDARSLQVRHSTGNSVIYDHAAFPWLTDDFIMPPWNELVVYEMHIGTFNDSPGGGPGDFYDAIDRLDHIQDLGVSAIEVMPIAEFAGDFSWGYNPAQPYAIETIYGGPAAYKEFVKSSHERGIAVFQDVVYNHFGPSDLELWRYDGWGIGDKGGIYFYNDYRSDTPWGDTRPDYSRGEVRSYLVDNALMWLEQFQVDGLRLDGTAYIRKVDGFGEDIPDGWSLMQWMNDEVDARQAWKYIIAEDMRSDDWITKTTGQGGAGFDGQWDEGFVHPVREVIVRPDDPGRNMYNVANAITNGYNNDAFERVIYTESHDEVANGKSRVPEEIWPGNADSWYSRKRSTLGAALALTSPGVPMIFMGQEFLEDGYFSDTDPLDWSKLTTFAGIYNMYRDMIQLRRNWYDNTRGLCGQNVNVFHINNTDNMIAYHRWEASGPTAGDDTIVVMNFANRSWDEYLIGLPAEGVWNVRLNSDATIYSDDFDNFGSTSVTGLPGGLDGLSHHGAIAIQAYSLLILSQ